MNHTVLITGANRGIGLALAQQYLQKDWQVLAVCRKPSLAQKLVLLQTTHPQLSILELDVADEAAIKQFGLQMTQQKIDVLINNAGINPKEQQSLPILNSQNWLTAFKVNTIAPIQLSAALVPSLRLSHHPRIVNISSQMGALGRTSGGGSYAYRTSKAALNKASQLLATDLRAEGVIVVPVHPGWVRTDMGGPNGEISAEDSAQGIYNLVENLTLSQSRTVLELGWQGACVVRGTAARLQCIAARNCQPGWAQPTIWRDWMHINNAQVRMMSTGC
ncbi:MAG TPA: SDR family oxidoreductase [Anaerolineales bacterium]|nr:SDR family oxidoreductase [Anaerolineales bacterium]